MAIPLLWIFALANTTASGGAGTDFSTADVIAIVISIISAAGALGSAVVATFARRDTNRQATTAEKNLKLYEQQLDEQRRQWFLPEQRTHYDKLREHIFELLHTQLTGSNSTGVSWSTLKATSIRGDIDTAPDTAPYYGDGARHLDGDYPKFLGEYFHLATDIRELNGEVDKYTDALLPLVKWVLESCPLRFKRGDSMVLISISDTKNEKSDTIWVSDFFDLLKNQWNIAILSRYNSGEKLEDILTTLQELTFALLSNGEFMVGTTTLARIPDDKDLQLCIVGLVDLLRRDEDILSKMSAFTDRAKKLEDERARLGRQLGDLIRRINDKDYYEIYFCCPGYDRNKQTT